MQGKHGLWQVFQAGIWVSCLLPLGNLHVRTVQVHVECRVQEVVHVDCVWGLASCTLQSGWTAGLVGTVSTCGMHATVPFNVTLGACYCACWLSLKP